MASRICDCRYKQSGIGRDKGQDALANYTQVLSIPAATETALPADALGSGLCLVQAAAGPGEASPCSPQSQPASCFIPLARLLWCMQTAQCCALCGLAVSSTAADWCLMWRRSRQCTRRCRIQPGSEPRAMSGCARLGAERLPQCSSADFEGNLGNQMYQRSLYHLAYRDAARRRVVFHKPCFGVFKTVCIEAAFG